MSQSDLAEAIDESIATVQFIETLRQPTIRLEKVEHILQKISDILDIEFDMLFPTDYLLHYKANFYQKKET